MADQRTVWDRDIPGPGLETVWDRDHAGPGTQTVWDLLPAVLGAVYHVILTGGDPRVVLTEGAYRVKLR